MYSKSLKKKSFVSNRKLFNLLKIKKSECKFKKKKLVQKKIWKKNILEDWEFISSINETIPAYFLRPRGDGPFPTIIYCHAHGGTYDKGRVELLKGRKSLLSDNLPNYYEILQIQKNTSQAEIKNQYRRLAKKWHPDREKSPDAERKMMQINMAYEVLSNPKRRKMYDQYFSE